MHDNTYISTKIAPMMYLTHIDSMLKENKFGFSAMKPPLLYEYLSYLLFKMNVYLLSVNFFVILVSLR